MDYFDPRSTGGLPHNVLGQCIEEILSLIKPLESDRNKRLNTVDELARSIQSIGTLKGAAVQPFGSFLSNLYSKWGDLDISITLDQCFNSSATRSKKLNILREIMKILRKRGLSQKVQFIPQARVPLLVYESRLYGISCDVSVDNHSGRVKSKILQLVTSLDDRFTDLVLLIKEWAKAQNINNPKSGTLNSYSLCLLVIFHLQTCEPAILPPLREIYNGNVSDDVEGVETGIEREIEDICALNIQKSISRISSCRNRSSLTDLLVSFFDKFSEIEALSSEYVICTFTGRWERMASNAKWTEKSYSLLIEDPFQQPDNSARAVGPHDLKTIAGAIQVTRQLLSSSSILSDRNSLLRLLSRPLISSLSAPRKPIYTHQQANLHLNRNVTQQGDGVVGYGVSAFSEMVYNQDRTTKIGTTGKVHTDSNQSTQLANGSKSSPKSNQREKSIKYATSSFQVAKNQVHDPNLTHKGNYSSRSYLGTVEPLYDPKLNHNHQNHQLGFSAQHVDRVGQDYLLNLNGSHRTTAEPKFDNSERKHRNSGIRFSGQTPERFDWGHDSGSSGLYKTAKASVRAANDPSLISNHQSRQLVGYSTASPGSSNLNYDAGVNETNMMYTSGYIGIVEPVTEQLHHTLKFTRQSYGSRSVKGKQIWQPKVASNHVFQ
ncbi:Poly(A) RNA polymerase cid11 [Rhynchospora pubera]|uniref:Poly(A) RNA polymerase cid11 n=1 Tax=Rhynchospora pubera TaxID=906938 RepID=A0AAV8FVP1_9POAL|nr:Poly(A) RNA polymerase cid11 [Rhynchospora pubera]KAJ4795849.1 Poly(A) RNA polymerase cid11 [Rhynchospora pubera]